MIRTVFVALRLARRELRRGLSGFRIFLACLILGVASIAGVGSLSEALLNGLSLQGRELLGGDAELRLTQREANAQERAWLNAHGRVSMTAELRTMATAQGKDARALVELKAVDVSYPLYGTADVAPRQPLYEAFANRQGVFGAIVDRSLLVRLGIAEGSLIKINTTLFEIRGTVRKEPDRVAGGFTLGPRVMISEFALRATGLIQPGSLINFNYRVALSPGHDGRKDVVAWLAAVDAALPGAGWQPRDRWNAAPGVRRAIEQVGAFLTLIGLTALVVGGVGVANAVRTYLDRRRDDIATLKCLGASGRFIFVMFLTEIMALAILGVIIGLLLGALLPFMIGWFLGDLIPFEADFDFYWRPVLSAAVFGLLTTFAFAIWPLALAREIPPAGMFRMLVAPSRRWPRFTYIALTTLAFGALAALGLLLTPNYLRLAGGFAGGAALTFAVLSLTSVILMRVAKGMRRPHNTMARLALANIHRPGAPTPAVILSLGLGLTLLASIALIDNNLRHRMADEIPKESPSHFFVDVQTAQVDEFKRLLAGMKGVSDVEIVPMLRGRIVKLNATPADKARVAREVRWALQGDRGITYGNPPGARSSVVKGEWWPANYKGPPLVSFSQNLADGMGLKIGDSMTVNVLGREFTFKIANLRRVDFSNARMNFIMVVSPGVLDGAPHAHLATARIDPAQDDIVEKALVAKFPSISIIKVREVLATANMVIDQIAAGVRSASLVTLITGLLVLAGAIAAGHRFRLYDAVVMKVLGATRRQVLTTYLIEFAFLGATAGLIAAVAGSVASWAVAKYVLEINFVLDLGTLLMIVVGGAFAAMLLGIGSTWGALRAPAASTLRTV